MTENKALQVQLSEILKPSPTGLSKRIIPDVVKKLTKSADTERVTLVV